jgi:uncharacterized membrane protein YdjX (TVP38/TMEM64 family)
MLRTILCVLGLLLLLVAVLLVTWALTHGGELSGWDINLSEKSFTDMIRGWGAWGVLGSIGLMVLHSFVPFPAEALTLANGMVYGPVKGALVTWVGAMLGAFLAFGLARLFGQPLVRKLLPPKHWQALEAWSQHSSWQALLVMRLIPVIAFNLINYAVGLTTVSVWTFFWTTAVGILPLTFLLSFMGDSMVAWPMWAWAVMLLAAFLLWLLLQRLTRSSRIQSGQ